VNEEPERKDEWKSKEGALYKIGGNSGVWQKRWFVLSRDTLAYYPTAEVRYEECAETFKCNVNNNFTIEKTDVGTSDAGRHHKGSTQPNRDGVCG